MNVFAQTEVEAIQRDGFNSVGKTFESRMTIIIGLMQAVEAFRAPLSLEERARRRRIAEQFDVRWEPWWRNFRKEALAEYQRTTLPD
jgi:hypothetical protein